MSEMKETIKTIFADGVDGISFLPSSEFEINVSGFHYTKKSKYEICNLGNVYHIMLYKCDDDGCAYHHDNFTAVLTDPHVYVNNIINCGFYGVVVKKTKTSTKFMKSVYQKVLDTIQDGNEA